MILFLAAQVQASPSAIPVDCLKPLTKEEQRQDNASRASERRAGSIPILEPDTDQLPVNSPADFKPQLVILSYLIGPDGRVSDCLVDRKATIDAFNAAGCDLLRDHMRGGAASSSRGRQKVAVNWTPSPVLPERRQCNNNHGTVPISSSRWIDSTVFNGTQVQAGSANVALDIGTTGSVERCTILAADVDRILQRNLCAMAVRHAAALPALDAGGNLTSATLNFVVRFRVAG